MKIIGSHAYGENKCLYQVSREALCEKRARWLELRGVGYGYADVKHSDWVTIADHALSGRGWALIAVNGPEGRPAHYGSIVKIKGAIRLQG